MEQNLDQSISLLSRTPTVLNALLCDLPEAWTNHNEGENTWTVFDVLGHLVHTERVDWMPRAKRLLEFGETMPFDPVDRWAQTRQNQNQTLTSLLDEFGRLRSVTLSGLRELNLHQKDLEKRGRHPALGPVTLSQLLAAWTVHDLTHLHQISRILAHQYREAVGPWSAYLGVLQCAGHSA